MILAAANPDISGQYVRPSSDPVLTPELEKQIADGTLKLAGNRSIEELERERDTMLWNGDATRLWIPMFALLCGPTQDWPRGRIVFNSSRDLFVLYADRKLMTPEIIAGIRAQFHLPQERTEVKSDFHYQSKETPDVLRNSPASCRYKIR